MKQGSHQPGKSENLGGQGKVREFCMESGEKEEKKKKKHEINKRTRNKKNREIRYIT